MARSKILVYVLLVILAVTPSLSYAWSGEVVGITDGDTITVLNSKTLKDVKIRLYGIDIEKSYSTEVTEYDKNDTALYLKVGAAK